MRFLFVSALVSSSLSAPWVPGYRISATCCGRAGLCALEGPGSRWQAYPLVQAGGDLQCVFVLRVYIPGYSIYRCICTHMKICVYVHTYVYMYKHVAK